MKVSGAKQVHYDSGPNMTPLVDVVMVILIFLMLAGSFGSDEHYMVSKTPMHDHGAPPVQVSPIDVPTQTVEVRVFGNGDFTIPSRGNTPLREPAEFRKQLADMAGQYQSAGGLDKVEVVLRPMPDTKWQALAPLYAAALEANYTKVAFAMTGSRR